MARRSYEGTGMLPGMDCSTSAAVPAAGQSRRVSQSPRSPKPRFSTSRVAAAAIAALVVLAATLYAFHRAEQFLIRDSRFILTVSGDAPSLEIAGASHASRRALERVFAEDAGGSVYLIPISARRDAVRAVDWVRDASVARIWPNRLVVRVWERKPVAFVRVSSSRFGLIDEDGVILPPASDRFALPVLAGLKSADPVVERRDGVRRMLRLTSEMDPDVVRKISEIDVSDGDNLKVTLPYDGRILTLLLGDRNFAARYTNFVNSYGEIRKRLPDATALDLRLEDRITVVE